MVDFLIIRNKCDEATRITNWLGDGLKPYLESQGYSVTDLSDNDATPENVNHWLNFNNMNVTKCVIALDHGSNDKFFGELNDKITDVININNVESLTKQLHIYTVACSTNAPNGLGENAIKKGCFSWLGYIDIVYVIQSQSFKDCIWTYIKAIAEGKTLEQCEQTLRDAYKARVNESFVYQYNLDRLLLRKKDNNMTIKTNYRRNNMNHIILFEHANFHGAHKHVFNKELNLNASDDNFFNDKVSSFIVLNGTWTLYRDANLQNPYAAEFPPGMYSWVEDSGVKNDDLSSLQCIKD